MCVAVRVRVRQNGWTALHVASQNGHEAVVRLLLDHRAKIEAKNNVRRVTVASATERRDSAALGEREGQRHSGAAAAGAWGVARRDHQREPPQSLHGTLQDGKKPVNVVCNGTPEKSKKPVIEALLRDGASHAQPTLQPPTSAGVTLTA